MSEYFVSILPAKQYEQLAADHRQRMCGSKKAYINTDVALEAMKEIKSKNKIQKLRSRIATDDLLTVYKCQYCNYYHIGHNTRK